LRAVVCLVALSLLPASGFAADPSEEVQIRRATGPIAIDGDLSDEGWQGSARVDRWFETNPGDNVEPRVANVARLTYDDKFFYAAFEFSDPDPSKIRAPLADRDNVPSSTDYGGVLLDTRNDGKTAMMFLANPRGVQYDAISSDTSGEDSSPDFFWDSQSRITANGWILEMRIPFASLRYAATEPQTWRIFFYRNYPRDRRYQMFSVRLPRGRPCFVCNAAKLTGLSDLPRGGNWVVAPYAAANQAATPRSGLGSDLVSGSTEATGGVDVKWTPNAVTALDLTVNPDFSQIESDVAQISANERFALFFPERRAFFLEGVDLFSTPIQAVYTRTITAPRWGARATGSFGSTAYTALVADDEGGGSVILPGSDSSGFANQDFKSVVSIARVRHDLGRSFVSGLASVREIRGGGFNRVVGPDFLWRPNDRHTVSGQFLFSDTSTPDRTDLSSRWDGRRLKGHGATASWQFSTATADFYAEYSDFGDDFRADNGFVPQVGVRHLYFGPGYTFRPTGFLSRLRMFLRTEYNEDRSGDLIDSRIEPGVGMDGRWGSFLQFRVAQEKIRTTDAGALTRRRFLWYTNVNPSLLFSQLNFSGSIGEEIDFANSRTGHGGRILVSGTIRPTDHLEFQLNGGHSWIDVRPKPGLGEQRLFTEQIGRLKATYTFNARSFLRLVGQWTDQRRNPEFYQFAVDDRHSSLSGSLLFAYKLNWQSVLFVGYGDDRERSSLDHLEPAGRQFFLKLSYAFQG